MGSSHLALGEAGEELAASFLEKKGLTVVGRRVRCRHGELDIVARDGPEWVFVEVKTRLGESMGTASEAMTRRKTGRMARAVREYIDRHSLWEQPIRCDLIAIDMTREGDRVIRHYPGLEMR